MISLEYEKRKLRIFFYHQHHVIPLLRFQKKGKKRRERKSQYLFKNLDHIFFPFQFFPIFRLSLSLSHTHTHLCFRFQFSQFCTQPTPPLFIPFYLFHHQYPHHRLVISLLILSESSSSFLQRARTSRGGNCIPVMLQTILFGINDGFSTFSQSNAGCNVIPI